VIEWCRRCGARLLSGRPCADCRQVEAEIERDDAVDTLLASFAATDEGAFLHDEEPAQ
jgi:hypothetical protein